MHGSVYPACAWVYVMLLIHNMHQSRSFRCQTIHPFLCALLLENLYAYSFMQAVYACIIVIINQLENCSDLGIVCCAGGGDRAC